ncbi:MAG: hypothetical protein K0B07_01320 [DPANN group archaeon]|nr:hypothetical protein [DPANN group archaeon]
MKYVKNHKVLLWIFLGTFVGSVNFSIGNYAVQPFLFSFGFPAHMFAPIMMCLAFFEIFTSQLSG